MSTILDIIQPIELLSGSYPDADETGLGCIMNVVSYIAGDLTITDKSDCACPVVTQIAIFLDDFMTTEERKQLLRYVLPISGSRTSDTAILSARAWACARFAQWCRDEAAASAASAESAESVKSANRASAASVWAASAASASAEYAASGWAERAATMSVFSARGLRASAKSAASAWSASTESEYQAYRQRCISRCMALLDEMLVMTTAEETPEMIQRAKQYVALSNKEYEGL